VTVAISVACSPVRAPRREAHAVQKMPEFDRPGKSERQGVYDALMRTSSIAYGDYFICRHCGAQYLVRYTELPITDSGSVYCDVCRRQMIQWNSFREPSYKLVKRPDQK
jgi:hypothetical protein